VRPFVYKELTTMKKLIIFCILFIASLGMSEDTKSDYPDINPEFNVHITRFIDLSGGVINEDDFDDVYIGFKKYKKEEKDTAGSCIITPFFRQVDINIDWWKKNTYKLSREELIFHELGHCVLYRSHTEPTTSGGIVGFFERLLFELGLSEKQGSLKDGCPMSYMHPSILSVQCVNKHYRYYISEIFEFENEDTFYYDDEEQVCKGNLKFFIQP